jgi:hypothetical protein
LGRRWVTKRKTLKAERDIPKLVYELVCVLLVIAAIIYAVVTGTAPDNSGF